MELTPGEKLRIIAIYVFMLCSTAWGCIIMIDQMRRGDSLRTALVDNAWRFLISVGLLLIVLLIRFLARRRNGQVIKKSGTALIFVLMFIAAFIVVFYLVEIIWGFSVPEGPMEDWFLLVPIGVTSLLALGLFTLLRSGFPDFLKPRKKNSPTPQEQHYQKHIQPKKETPLTKQANRINEMIYDPRLGTWGSAKLVFWVLRSIGMIGVGFLAVIVSIFAKEDTWSGIVTGLIFLLMGFAFLFSNKYAKARIYQLENSPQERADNRVIVYLGIIYYFVVTGIVIWVVDSLDLMENPILLGFVIPFIAWVVFMVKAIKDLLPSKKAAHPEPEESIEPMADAAVQEEDDPNRAKRSQRYGILLLVVTIILAAVTMIGIFLRDF